MVELSDSKGKWTLSELVDCKWEAKWNEEVCVLVYTGKVTSTTWNTESGQTTSPSPLTAHSVPESTTPQVTTSRILTVEPETTRTTTTAVMKEIIKCKSDERVELLPISNGDSFTHFKFLWPDSPAVSLVQIKCPNKDGLKESSQEKGSSAFREWYSSNSTIVLIFLN